MDRSELYNRPDNIFRPVNWRWLRASFLVDDGGPLSPGHDDGPVQEAVRYLRAWRACRAEEELQRLARDMPDLYGAHRLHLARSFQTWEAQARLLTEESFAQVAEKGGSHPRVIETYHDTFFHVRDRLHIESYIGFEVIGPQGPLRPDRGRHRRDTQDLRLLRRPYRPRPSGGPLQEPSSRGARTAGTTRRRGAEVTARQAAYPGVARVGHAADQWEGVTQAGRPARGRGRVPAGPRVR